MVQASPTAKPYQATTEWLPDDATLPAHNARFDYNILCYEYHRAQLSIPSESGLFDKHSFTKVHQAKQCRLQQLKEYYHIKTEGNAHRALPDADNQ